MGSQETVVPEKLIELANNLDDRVGPELDKAKWYFEQAEIDGGAFTAVGLAMQVVYPGTREWAIKDAESKNTELRSITDKLANTAKQWAKAEEDSTVREV